jgi:hypothetical protein
MEDEMSEEYPTFYDTMVSSPQWKLWYEEIMRRHLINEKGGEWKDNKTFDIDESQECGWLGDEHFQEFIKFCCSTQQAQMREEIHARYEMALGFRVEDGKEYKNKELDSFKAQIRDKIEELDTFVFWEEDCEFIPRVKQGHRELSAREFKKKVISIIEGEE